MGEAGTRTMIGAGEVAHLLLSGMTIMVSLPLRHEAQTADIQTDQNVVVRHHHTTKLPEPVSDPQHHPDTLPLYPPAFLIQQKSITFSASVNSRSGSVHHIHRLQRLTTKKHVESGRSWRAVLEVILEKKRSGWQSVMIVIERSIPPVRSVPSNPSRDG